MTYLPFGSIIKTEEYDLRLTRRLAMTYVLSDIHGQMRRFQSVMKQINLQPEDTLYVLGDVIDRYPDGIKILRQSRNRRIRACRLPAEQRRRVLRLHHPDFLQ